MIAALTGLLLALAVSACIIAVAWKAQSGAKASGYFGMSAYGKDAQTLQDKNELHRFGLAQVLARRWRGAAVLGLSFNTMAMIGGAALLYGPALAAGGPSVIGIGMPLLALLSVPVAAALAELASAVPTAGGIYHGAYLLGGRRWAARAGWLHAAGHAALLALMIGGCAYLTDTLLAAKLGYASSAYTFWALAAVIAASQAAANRWGAPALGRLAAAGVWLQLLLAVSILAGLVWLFWPGDYSPILLYELRDASWGGAVRPEAWALGTLMLLKLFTGMDGAAHGAEETMEPRVHVPWSIYLSTAYTFVIGFALLMFMTLALPSALSLPPLAEPVQSPMHAAGGSLFLQSALASWGGSVAIGLLVLASLWISGFQSMAVCARALFSMARDEALPFSDKLAAVSVRRQIPDTAVWGAAVAAFVMLACFALAGTEGALLPILSLAIVSLHIAYAIPIGLRLKALRGKSGSGLRGDRSSEERIWRQAPWQLGGWSRPIHAIAVLWLTAGALLTAACVHSSGAVGIAVILLLATLLDFRYSRRQQRSWQRRAGRDTKELSAAERRYPLS